MALDGYQESLELPVSILYNCDVWAPPREPGGSVAVAHSCFPVISGIFTSAEAQGDLSLCSGALQRLLWVLGTLSIPGSPCSCWAAAAWGALLIQREHSSPLFFFFPDPVLGSERAPAPSAPEQDWQRVCKWLWCVQGRSVIIQTQKCILCNSTGGIPSIQWLNCSWRCQVWCPTFVNVSPILFTGIFICFLLQQASLTCAFSLFVFQCDSDSDQEEKVRKKISMRAKLIYWIPLFLLIYYLFKVSSWTNLKHLYTKKISVSNLILE